MVTTDDNLTNSSSHAIGMVSRWGGSISSCGPKTRLFVLDDWFSGSAWNITYFSKVRGEG